MAEAMHRYFPPAADLYFVVVGVKFKAFGLVDSLVMVAVKFGRSLEINLIGVSSILFPSAFIELAWTARFVPESGYLFIGGQLTERSYLLGPGGADHRRLCGCGLAGRRTPRGFCRQRRRLPSQFPRARPLP